MPIENAQNLKIFPLQTTHEKTMSAKLSPALKALLTASHARGSALPVPAKIDSLFDSVYKSAKSVGLGHDIVLTLSVS